MHVVATAGHVDHGKSTLVRALTGIEPDRLAEEQRRGMTIDLGFAWTTLPTGEEVAFVDVPGHERFVTTMLAGVGPVPAVVVVVAADEGWKPQTEEHMAAVAALGVRHLLVVITKADIGDADRAARDVARHLDRHGYAEAPCVAVSARTGDGLDVVGRSIADLVRGLPEPDATAPVRFWIDRAFTIRGAGTVVTGTLAAGTLTTGATLELGDSAERVTIRGLESLRRPVPTATPVARVAVNLRSANRARLQRGTALVTPDAWTVTDSLDVVLGADDAPAHATVHVGSAAVPTRVRRLGSRAARLTLARPLPLHLNDRLLLREPSARWVTAADVADLHPEPLRRRGDAGRAGAGLTVPVTADDEVRRRGVTTVAGLRRAGVGPAAAGALVIGGFVVADRQWQQWSSELTTLLVEQPDGVSIQDAQRRLDLPSPDILTELVRQQPALRCRDGRVEPAAAAPAGSPELTELVSRLTRNPLDAPDAQELAELHVDRSALARAARDGRLLRISDSIVLGSAAVDVATERLAALPEPFTVSAARQVLGTSRRVAVPLLEHLDAARRTVRLPDGTRRLVHRE